MNRSNQRNRIKIVKYEGEKRRKRKFKEIYKKETKKNERREINGEMNRLKKGE